MARKDSENQKKSMSLLFRGRAIFKPLNTGWIDDQVACVREWVANIFFYTEICKPFTKKYTDPSAPYDGYIEDDDTEYGARNVRLEKVK